MLTGQLCFDVIEKLAQLHTHPFNKSYSPFPVLFAPLVKIDTYAVTPGNESQYFSTKKLGIGP